MKPYNNIALLLLLLLMSGITYAQSELVAENASFTPSNAAALFKSDDKITISEFVQDLTNANPTVNVKCQIPLAVQVKVFNMDGNMAKLETYQLEKGLTELNLKLDDLAAGSYMVQIYSKEGSAVRRFVKPN